MRINGMHARKTAVGAHSIFEKIPIPGTHNLRTREGKFHPRLGFFQRSFSLVLHGRVAKRFYVPFKR